ncbi:MAG: DNA polymerase III subunit gamma/tau [Bacteroidales bacterium]|nr:DNA polymerase III subunit gamma/tau [Bacteroidales bacterium]
MDNFVVSARKYRPTTFNEVVGQSAITNTLKNAIKNNHIAQAFLFTGPRGVGKTTCARVFAKTINCQNLTADIEPCNECDSCKSFNTSNSFNVHELDAASNNSVEDIRRLVEQVRIPPQVGQYKIYIIDEVHMLSQAAFNAFLKTLEEPPTYAKFILATTEKHKIIPTILSRCQIYDFNRITTSDIVHHLSYVAQKEHISTEEEALHIIAKKADGALRDALSIFDQQVSFCGDNITYEATIENLNVLHTEYYFRLIDHVLTGDVTNTLILYNEVISKGFEGQHFINGVSEHLRNLLVVKDAATIKLIDTAENIKSRYLEQTKFCSLRFLVESLKIMSEVDLNYKSVTDKRIYVELNLLKLCDLSGKLPQESVANLPMPKAAIQPKPEPQKPQEIKVERAETDRVQPRKSESPATPSPPTAPTSPQSTKQEPIKSEQKPQTSAPISFGLSIKSDINTVKSEMNKRKDAEESETDYVTADVLIPVEDLVDAVLSYGKQIEAEERAFSSALRADRITIKENNTIHIIFTNKSIDDQDLKTKLLQELRQRFDNNQIKITTEVIEQQVSHRDEPMENYKKMVEKNPVVEQVRSQLGLNF